MRWYIVIFVLPIILLAEGINITKKEFTVSPKIKSWIEFKNENLIRQEYDYSCGSAALATIMRYFYDQNISEKIVLEDILVSKGIGSEAKQELEEQDFALSFFDLARFAGNKNFKGIGLALDRDSLKELKLPVILFVKIRKNEHFTVYKGMDGRYVYLADPSFGNIAISHAKFDEMFYQRNDLHHPGKILTIIPVDLRKRGDKDFLEFESFKGVAYKAIKMKLFEK
ncbi:MAG: uncharacterized protein QG567_2000 [Campylobacterota bacterium]|nr:uncharacterized protein [Campylobacterota bacterium]